MSKNNFLISFHRCQAPEQKLLFHFLLFLSYDRLFFAITDVLLGNNLCRLAQQLVQPWTPILRLFFPPPPLFKINIELRGLKIIYAGASELLEHLGMFLKTTFLSHGIFRYGYGYRGYSWIWREALSQRHPAVELNPGPRVMGLRPSRHLVVAFS